MKAPDYFDYVGVGTERVGLYKYDSDSYLSFNLGGETSDWIVTVSETKARNAADKFVKYTISPLQLMEDFGRTVDDLTDNLDMLFLEYGDAIISFCEYMLHMEGHPTFVCDTWFNYEKLTEEKAPMANIDYAKIRTFLESIHA